jgi:O-antigen biosynthesis protein
MNRPTTKVLVIGYVWPEPRSSAAGGHMMQILETFLAQGWDITFSSPAALGEHKADLQALGIAERAIELNNSSAGASKSTAPTPCASWKPATCKACATLASSA